MLLSCLSAHAALVVFDGIERTTLDDQVHRCLPPARRSLIRWPAGLGSPVVLPHSRLNTVEVDEVLAAGYEVVLQSDAVGWSVITKATGGRPGRARPGSPRVRSFEPAPRVPP